MDFFLQSVIQVDQDKIWLEPKVAANLASLMKRLLRDQSYSCFPTFEHVYLMYHYYRSKMDKDYVDVYQFDFWYIIYDLLSVFQGFDDKTYHPLKSYGYNTLAGKLIKHTKALEDRIEFLEGETNEKIIRDLDYQSANKHLQTMEHKELRKMVKYAQLHPSGKKKIDFIAILLEYFDKMKK